MAVQEREGAVQKAAVQKAAVQETAVQEGEPIRPPIASGTQAFKIFAWSVIVTALSWVALSAVPFIKPHARVDDAISFCKLLSVAAILFATFKIACGETRQPLRAINFGISMILLVIAIILLVGFTAGPDGPALISGISQWFGYLFQNSLILFILALGLFALFDLAVFFKISLPKKPNILHVSKGEKNRILYYLLFVDLAVFFPLLNVVWLSWALPRLFRRSTVVDPIPEHDMHLIVSGAVLFLLFAHAIAQLIVDRVVADEIAAEPKLASGS